MVEMSVFIVTAEAGLACFVPLHPPEAAVVDVLLDTTEAVAAPR